MYIQSAHKLNTNIIINQYYWTSIKKTNYFDYHSTLCKHSQYTQVKHEYNGFYEL